MSLGGFYFKSNFIDLDVEDKNIVFTNNKSSNDDDEEGFVNIFISNINIYIFYLIINYQYIYINSFH